MRFIAVSPSPNKKLCLMRQDQKFCVFTRNWLLFVMFTAGARTVKMSYFLRSGKQSNIQFGPMLGSAPLLVIGHVFTVVVIGLV